MITKYTLSDEQVKILNEIKENCRYDNCNYTHDRILTWFFDISSGVTKAMENIETKKMVEKIIFSFIGDEDERTIGAIWYQTETCEWRNDLTPDDVRSVVEREWGIGNMYTKLYDKKGRFVTYFKVSFNDLVTRPILDYLVCFGFEDPDAHTKGYRYYLEHLAAKDDDDVDDPVIDTDSEDDLNDLPFM